MQDEWHSLDVDSVLDRLETTNEGLSTDQAIARQEIHGLNKLVVAEKITPFTILMKQFANILVVILLIAVGISFLVGELTDAILILIIVLISTILGFTQEYRAERSLQALQGMLKSTASILRDGEAQTISIEEIVPGDIVLLKEGDKIPADSRIVHANNLKINEAVMTGESVPVQKSITPLPASTRIPDRKNIALSGTEVTMGKANAVVYATGMETEFGKIAAQVAAVTDEETPLEKRTMEIGKWLGGISIIVCAVVVIVGVLESFLLNGEVSIDFILKMVFFGIALAVAVVPEALPAVVTGSLAIGMNRMAKSNALVRKMSAVETLGCTTVICSDKTGTITKGEMTVREVYIHGSTISIEGEGYEPVGKLVPDQTDTGVLDSERFQKLLKGSVLCNDANLVEEEGTWRIAGDPTEGALVVLGEKAGLQTQEIRRQNPRFNEIPFSSERKRMTTIHSCVDHKNMLYTKGAPETVVERCKYIWTKDGVIELGPSDRAQILQENERMASKALRVLSLAFREIKAHEDLDVISEDLEDELVFIGLVGMIDPPRRDAIRSIEISQSVGIRTVMITGDHKLTALAVAEEVGIYQKGDLVLTDQEIEKLSDAEFDEIVEDVSVYARVSPLRKLKIVQAWKRRGEIVAMTGDGVNDAPALKQADIGIAMGITGTDVSKEASDVVLADDNFASIGEAIELGRWIYDNIKKYLAYLLRANLIEIIVLSFVVLMGYPLPLLPAQILYINLVTDGLPAIALGLSPPDPDIMEKPPRDPDESIFSKDVKLFYVFTVLIQAPLFIFIFMTMAPLGVVEGDLALTNARTVLFYLFIMCELALALTCRSLRYTIWEVRPHKLLWISVIGSAVLTIFLFNIPSVTLAFSILPLNLLSWWQLFDLFAICILTLIAVELFKYVVRRYVPQNHSRLEVRAEKAGKYQSSEVLSAGE